MGRWMRTSYLCSLFLPFCFYMHALPSRGSSSPEDLRGCWSQMPSWMSSWTFCSKFPACSRPSPQRRGSQDIQHLLKVRSRISSSVLSLMFVSRVSPSHRRAVHAAAVSRTACTGACVCEEISRLRASGSLQDGQDRSLSSWS